MAVSVKVNMKSQKRFKRKLMIWTWKMAVVLKLNQRQLQMCRDRIKLV